MRIRRPAVGWLALAPLALAPLAPRRRRSAASTPSPRSASSTCRRSTRCCHGPAQIKVDTSSERLLADRDLAPVSRGVFLERDKADRGYLDELTLLRRQVDLLGDYFTALDALATSDPPQAFGTTLASTAGSLDTLSQELRGRGRQERAGGAGLASGVGSLVVKRAESRALQRELEQRGETIAQVLRSVAILGAIRDQTASSLAVTRNRDYEEQVEDPYLTPRRRSTRRAGSRRATRASRPRPGPAARRRRRARRAACAPPGRSSSATSSDPTTCRR